MHRITALTCSCSKIIANKMPSSCRSVRALYKLSFLPMSTENHPISKAVACYSTSSSLNASAKVRVVKTPVKLTPTKAPLTLTKAAISRVSQLMKERPDVVGVRISVRQRGCSGLTYTFDYVEDENTVKAPSSTDSSAANENDSGIMEKNMGRTKRHNFDVEVVQDGIRIFIDRRAQLTLLGTEMDYVETKLGSEFVFSNPNIKSTCGCGESFMLS